MSESPPRVYGRRARMALMVPSPNTVAETEFWRMAPSGVTVHTARMPFFGERFDEPFAAMERDVPRVLEEVASAEPDVIAYGCTASSAKPDALAYESALGERAGRPTVTAAASLVRALRHLGASRIALVTPYPQSTNDKERDFFARHGITVVSDRSIIVDPAQMHFRHMSRVPGERLATEALDLGAGNDVEAVVLSCCDMATLDVIEAVEARLGKPVATSTQALFWSALRAAGIDEPRPGAGLLLSR